jgi:hypothetical protein
MRFNRYGRFHGSMGDDPTVSALVAPTSVNPAAVAVAASQTPQPGPSAVNDPVLFSSMNTQLTNLENQLIDIYNQKTQMVADRELARFHYLSAWRSQLEGIMQGIMNDVTQVMTSSDLDYMRAFLGTIKANVPMMSLDGFLIQGTVNPSMPAYSANPQIQALVTLDYIGSTPVGLLSPMENIFVIPDSSGVPFYTTSAARNIGDTFSLAGSYPFQVPWIDGNGQLQNGASPFDANTLHSFIDMSENHGTINIANKYPSDPVFMLSLFSKVYPGGDLNSTMQQGFNLWNDLNQKTLALIHLQYQIDDLENQATQFVNAAKNSGVLNPAINSSAVFKNLQDLASQFNTAASLQTVSAAQLAQTGATNPPAPKPSSAGLWMALAAGALVLVGGGKK